MAVDPHSTSLEGNHITGKVSSDGMNFSPAQNFSFQNNIFIPLIIHRLLYTGEKVNTTQSNFSSDNKDFRIGTRVEGITYFDHFCNFDAKSHLLRKDRRPKAIYGVVGQGNGLFGSPGVFQEGLVRYNLGRISKI